MVSTQTNEYVSSRLSVGDFSLVAAVYVGAMLAVAGFPHFTAGFPLDDSWIHQVVARNLARDGTLGFIPGVRSSGSSSLLWSFLLAVKWRFLPGVGPVLYSGVLSGFLLVASGWGLLAMARRDRLPRAWCWIWALTPALDGNFVWLGLIGMEHILFVALSIFGIYFWFQSSFRSAIGSALCLGALSLTRPEGLVLAVLVVLSSQWARRGRRDVAIVCLMVGVCVLLFLTANYVTSHSWLPTTFSGRKWLYFGTEHVRLRHKLVFPYVLGRSLLSPWAINQTHILYIFNTVMVVLSGFGGWALIQRRGARTLSLCGWSLVHILIYSAMLPARGHGGRYQPLFLALTFPLLFLGVDAVLSLRATARERWQVKPAYRYAAVVVAVVLCGVLSLRAWRTVTRDGVTLIETSHAPMARSLLATLPPGTVVAAFDIGRMGFIYGVGLVDLGGLTDTSFLPYMRQHRMMNYLIDRNIHYFVWPTFLDGKSGVPQVFDFEPDAMRGVKKVETVCAAGDIWKVSYNTTTSAAQCQSLFRLE